MKANGAKRKIFNDAIDLLDQMEEAAAVPGNVVRMLPTESIRPFRGHPFRMYEGERLDDMVQSIREHGVLNPVIVRKQEDGYEMLSGHNRQRAAMLAGIEKIPAIVKENLSDEDAIVYVIETNMIQRSFSELLPSEKAAVLAVRYEKISSQGKRNDILQEIAALNGQDGTCGFSASSRTLSLNFSQDNSLFIKIFCFIHFTFPAFFGSTSTSYDSYVKYSCILC